MYGVELLLRPLVNSARNSAQPPRCVGAVDFEKPRSATVGLGIQRAQQLRLPAVPDRDRAPDVGWWSDRQQLNSVLPIAPRREILDGLAVRQIARLAISTLFLSMLFDQPGHKFGIGRSGIHARAQPPRHSAPAIEWILPAALAICAIAVAI